jgi:hypothetical protein
MKDKTISLKITFSEEDIDLFETFMEEGRDKGGILEHIVSQWYLINEDDDAPPRSSFIDE